MWLLRGVKFRREAGNSLAVQWLRFHISVRGAQAQPRVPQGSYPRNRNVKQKQYCNKKFNKDLKNGPHKFFFKKREGIRREFSLLLRDEGVRQVEKRRRNFPGRGNSRAKAGTYEKPDSFCS